MAKNSPITLELVLKEYFHNNKSATQIAEEYHTYPNKINRMLKKAGYELRTRSEAQQVALETGRSEHPTKGKEMSDETKIKISKAQSENWENMSEADIEHRRQIGKQIWESMSKSEQRELMNAGHNAVRDAAKQGSKFERWIRDQLLSKGYKLQFHRESLVHNSKLEIDIYLSDYGIAIEIDGPSHFFPIWGDEKFVQQQKADKLKEGLLALTGFRVIRVRQKIQEVPLYKQQEVLVELLKILTNVKKYPNYVNIDVE